MRYLLFIAVVFLSACQVVTETEYIISDEVASLSVGNDATDAMLNDIAEEFEAKKGILIDYSETQFNSKGTISYLILKVDVNGSIGGVEADYKATNRRFGFAVDYRPNAGTMLRTGLMDK